jgi:RNA polymerase sigma factor (sigma-70 family)
LKKTAKFRIFHCKNVDYELLIGRGPDGIEGRLSVKRRSFRQQLEPLWRAKYQRWVGYAWGLVGNKADAEDVVQDAAHSSLKANPDVDGEKETDAYMHAAIKSSGIKHARRFALKKPGRRFLARVAPLAAGEKSLIDVAIEVEDDLENDRLSRIAMSGLDQLPAEQREALELVVLRDPKVPLREVAERQGVSISAVRWRVNKALETLRELDEAFSGGRK